jgi:uncharacterized protein YukE
MWEALGGADPVPGDPFALRNLASRFGEVADDTGRISRRLDSVADQAGPQLWRGCAADLFRDQLAEVLPDLAKLARSHDLARQALLTYATVMETAQETARRAGGDANRAADEERSARAEGERADTDRSAFLAEARVAEAALRTAQIGLVETAVLPDPARSAALTQEESRQQVRRAAALARVSEASGRHDRAESEAAEAHARLEMARQLAADARQLRGDGGNTAVRQLHEASEVGIHNRGMVERAYHATVTAVRDITSTEEFRQFIALVSSVGDTLVSVGTLVALVFPAAGAFIAAVGVGLLAIGFIGQLLAFSVGNAKGKDVAMSALNLGLSALGARKLASVAKATPQLFGGAIALGGKVKRSFSYADNRHLSGLARTLLWESVPVAKKEAVPFFKNASPQVEKVFYQVSTAKEVLDKPLKGYELIHGPEQQR